jgi:hypothetical protein
LINMPLNITTSAIIFRFIKSLFLSHAVSPPLFLLALALTQFTHV